MTNTTRESRLLAAGVCPPVQSDVNLSIEEMNALLERERLRSDRSGSAFAVLAMDAATDTIEAIINTLRDRVRKTDVIGYAAPNVIGVFLPDTHARGAWKLVEDILALLPEDVSHPNCSVYVYPEPDWLDDLRDSDRRMHRHNGEPGGPSHQRNGHADYPTSNGTSTNGHGKRNGHVDSDSLSRSVGLRSHFSQPLPLWKRGLDIVGALCAMVLFSPLFVSAAVAVKISSRGPIFFSQRRAGLGGRPFTIWKFRTMRVGAEAQQQEIMHLNEQDGAAFKVKDDPRVTTIGKILRKTSIDELPQLWNVLLGDMSLVGPRPLPLHEAANCEPWQKRRLDVTPGVTCTWQAHGRSSVSFEEWMRMDLRYAERRTLWRDFVLLLQTISAVLGRRGAS